METMHLFRIDYKDRGLLVCLRPEVQKNRLPNEDSLYLMNLNQVTRGN